MNKQIDNFLEYIKTNKKFSENTLQSYRRDIVQYQNYIESNNLNYSKMETEDIKTYLQYLQDMNKKASTISRNLASIRLFYQYELRNNKIKTNPTDGVQSPKIEKRVPSILTSQEVNLLLEQPKNVDLKGTRDKAMLEFAYATGMRVTEIISLNVSDVNIAEGYVTCKNTNKSKQRNIPLGKISLNTRSKTSTY